MTTKKMFQCKYEDLPVIGEFVVESARRDLADFSGFSPVFTPSYLDGIGERILLCKEKMRSWVVVQELKSVTEKLANTTTALRLKLNALEGYLKLASFELDVKVTDMGLSVVRDAIRRGNTESVIAGVSNLLVAVKRNQVALTEKGMNPELIAEITVQTQEINSLNVKQNELESVRNRLTEEDTGLFNELWKALFPVFETGKALYRGVNDAKLKDYTMTQLKKRINAKNVKKEAEKSE